MLQRWKTRLVGNQPVPARPSPVASTELCNEIGEAMRNRASRIWQRTRCSRNLLQQSCISTPAWNRISRTRTARHYGTKGPIRQMREGWGNQSPEQGIKYTAATLICFGPGKITMELMGYFWGCVKGTCTGPVLEPSEAGVRLFLISASFGWDAWFPCAADTLTNYWSSHMCVWNGRHRKMLWRVYHEMNRNAAVK